MHPGEKLTITKKGSEATLSPKKEVKQPSIFPTLGNSLMASLP